LAESRARTTELGLVRTLQVPYHADGRHVVALVRFHPSATGGFFLLGGLGLGTIHLEVDGFGNDTETGGGALLGLAYDIRMG
jgi:hypothetical protein